MAALARISGPGGFITSDAGYESVVGSGWHAGVDFSGGQRKLLGLAVALHSNAPILVLDEPTANVSRDTGMAIQAEVCERAKKEGRTVMIVSHNLENFAFCESSSDDRRRQSDPRW